MSIELAIAGASIGVASIVAIAALGNEHLSNPLRTVHQQNTPHPRATNIIAGAAAGVSTMAVALALSIPTVAVTWSLGALTVWAVAADKPVLALLFLYNGAVSIPALVQKAGRDTIHFLHHNHALFDRAASWVVNSAAQILPSWLNVRSCLGLVTAAELNAFDDRQLSCVNVRILKRLPMEELLKLKPPVLMSCSDSEVSELLARAKDDSISKSIRNEADNLSAFAGTIQVRQLST